MSDMASHNNTRKGKSKNKNALANIAEPEQGPCAPLLSDEGVPR